jgi:pimeloyl-ACP methyl ester carboxylesterase
MKSLLTTILCLFLFTTYGQESGTTETGTNSDTEGYEAKMIQTSRMNMEYMDFGGEGNTLIHIQGVHNASALKNNPQYMQNYTAWRDMLTAASEKYRVYAPIYRGRGNSDKDGDDIFKVENIALDILAFMDEMKIEKATFVGRTTAPQVMFYLAENYPDRVEAMVVTDNSMYKAMPILNSEIRDFMYYCSYAAMDLGDLAPDIVMPSYDYVPTFYTDDTKKIDIPLFWPYSVQMNVIQMNLMLLNYLQADNAFIPNPQARKYFNDLYTNKELQDNIKQYYAENDLTQESLDALKRTFGDQLTLLNIDELKGANYMENFKKGEELMMEYLISIGSKE